MSTADEFLSRFDEEGRFKALNGEVGVTFLTQSGARYPAKLRFRDGLLVNAVMDGAGRWGYPDDSPLDGLKFLLHFREERPLAVFVEQGRVVHGFEVQDQARKNAFLTNFRLARSLFGRPKVSADNPLVDTASVADALRRSALWLTPRVVEGFNAADFPELKADRRAELEDAVNRFEAVASQVPADKPPTDDQYRAAAAAFTAALGILSPYLPISEESEKVETALRRVDFPSWVVNWDYELGNSEDGAAAVWVNVFTDGNVARGDYGRFGLRIIPMIRQALAAEGIDRWPYIRLRTISEYQTA